MKKETPRLITLLFASSIAGMGGGVVIPAMPQILEHFQDVPNAGLMVRLFLTTPGLFTAIGAPLAGLIVDKYGRKKLLLCAIFLYGLGGTTGCYLDSLYALMVGRALLGLSAAGTMTTCVTLMADYYDEEKRHKLMGYQFSFISFGSTIFLALGGVLAEIHWRVPFFIYAIPFLIFIAAAIFITEPQKKEKGISIQSEEPKEKFPYLILGSIYALIYITMAIFYLKVVIFPFYMNEIETTSSTKVGLALASAICISALVSLGYGYIKRHFSYIHISLAVFIIVSIGYLILYKAGSYWGAVIGLIITSLGFGLFAPNVTVWVNAVTPEAYRGRAVGGMTTCIFLGMFSSPLIAHPLTLYFSLAETYAVAALFLLGLSAAFILYSLKKRLT
jgi:MFS family permease